MRTRAVIVVPTIREAHVKAFLQAWAAAFEGHTVIVVEDNPEKTFDIPAGRNVEHYSWSDIDHELGQDAWIIPRRTDCIRSYGYFKAFHGNADFVVTLDDDCLPVNGGSEFLAMHWARLNAPGPTHAWTSTLEGAIPRGVPYYCSYRTLPCVLNHGLWEEAPDFDAVTQLAHSRKPYAMGWRDMTIPVGSYFPMCGMNLAFRKAAIPALYFLLMGKDQPYDRFGDIWAGVILKKIADHLGYCVQSGQPPVRHSRASNVWANLRKEAPGLEVNEQFWVAVDSVRLTGGSFGECYREIAEGLKLDGEYWCKLKRAMVIWTELFVE